MLTPRGFPPIDFLEVIVGFFRFIVLGAIAAEIGAILARLAAAAVGWLIGLIVSVLIGAVGFWLVYIAANSATWK